MIPEQVGLHNRMMRTAIEKFKKKSGVTLTETLIALIFCLMTFALVCSAIAAGGRELKRETMQSEAKMLCSTLTMAIEDELRYARSIEGSRTDDITYSYSQRAGTAAKNVSIKNKTERDKNTGVIIVSVSDGADGSTEYTIVPDEYYTQGMKASLELNWGTAVGSSLGNCFTGTVTVTDSSETKVLASQSFAVRPMNY